MIRRRWAGLFWLRLALGLLFLFIGFSRLDQDKGSHLWLAGLWFAAAGYWFVTAYLALRRRRREPAS
jgi:hypothetical protein